MNDDIARRVDTVVWWFGATARLAAQTEETVRARARIVLLEARYERSTPASRAGHLFEEMHALSFNLDAIRKDRQVRAEVTEWFGLQNAAVDLRLVEGGTVVGHVQAKLMTNPVACAHQLGRDSYRGMQRLVGADDRPAVDRVLTKARTTLNPDSLGYDGRVDAHTRLTDSVAYGDVCSTPVARTDVRRLVDRPVDWADRQVASARAREIGAGAVTGAVSGAAVGAVVEAVTQVKRVRSGDTTTADAAAATGLAALHGSLRSGLVGGLGATVRVAAVAGVVPRAVGRGGVPMAVAGVAVDVAEAGIAFCRDEIDAGQLAARSGESVLQAGLTFAFAALGQLALPVLPGLGATIGGLVGGVLASAAVDGLRWWFCDESAAEPTEPRQIEAVPSADDLMRHVAELIAAYGLVTTGGSAPGRDEFDEWMADPTASLTLDPNPA